MAEATDRSSFSELVNNLTRDISALVRKEMELARAEMGSKVSGLQKGLMSIIGGSLIAVAALVILLQAVVYALVNGAGFAPWAAAIVVGGLAALAGLVIAMNGAKSLQKSADPTPHKTTQSVREDAGLVREKAR